MRRLARHSCLWIWIGLLPGCSLSSSAESAAGPDGAEVSSGAPRPGRAPPPASAEAPASSAPPSPAAPAAAACREDMVLVDGSYCEELEQRCLRPRKPWQCAEYEVPARCRGATRPLRFCIDRYEHPNREGALPTLMVSWQDARAACTELGKRLCTEAEWTLACEGPERLAFPYGHVRDGAVCAIDKPSPLVNEQRLFYRGTQAAEIARLDQREPSGARPRCVSAYGVHDLTGNVDEWVRNESGRPFQSSLKGGNWGEYRNACRPATRGHDEGFRYYQTGFRCCGDPDPPRSLDAGPG